MQACAAARLQPLISMRFRKLYQREIVGITHTLSPWRKIPLVHGVKSLTAAGV
jgi:hypothetical protein